MPHSVFTGRVVEPGEPLFLLEDTDGAVALAEEERDTCSSCGWPKVWCRDPANQFALEPHGEQCHVTYALSEHNGSDDPSRAAMQTSARFRPGMEPDVYAGLGLESERDENPGDHG